MVIEHLSHIFVRNRCNLLGAIHHAGWDRSGVSDSSLCVLTDIEIRIPPRNVHVVKREPSAWV